MEEAEIPMIWPSQGIDLKLRQARQESLFPVVQTGRDSTRPRPNGRFFPNVSTQRT